MRERVDALGVSEPEIQRSGENQISVGLPDVTNADEAQQQVGQVAQLFFYDWEPNVIGPDGPAGARRTRPVTGGSAAGQPTDAALSKFEAVNRAAERPEINDGNNTHEGLFYAVQPSDREVVAGPEDSREDLQEDIAELPADERRGVEIREVKAGTIIVRAEQPDDIPQDQKGDEWYVLADNVALRGTDIKNPEQNFDQGAGGSGGPIVTFEFTDRGKDIWQDVTERIAQRGQSLQLPGTSAQESAQHFAIVLDDELISAPFIDFVQNPNGIDGSNGSQIEGGFTLDSAQELANLLKTGALPVRLELISQSQVSATLGQQSLDQGLIAGIGGFTIVALFLLIFYRILGVIAVTALCVYAPSFFALIKLVPITLTLPGIAGLILTIGRRGRREHRHLRARQGGDPRGRSVTAGLAAGYKKGIARSSTRTSSRSSSRSSCSCSRPRASRASRSSRRRHDRLAVHRGPVHAGDRRHARALQAPRPAVRARRREAQAADHIDFVGLSKWFFSASGLILLVCALAIGGKGIDLGIDFESGTRVRAAIDRPTNEDGIRAAIASTPAADAEIQRVEEPELGANVFQVSAEELRPNEVAQVTDAIDERFGLRGEPNTTSIGPTFGNTVAESAIVAIIASLIVIAVYLALRFGLKYAARCSSRCRTTCSSPRASTPSSTGS
jgi:SecD/SecF fusion protein